MLKMLYLVSLLSATEPQATPAPWSVEPLMLARQTTACAATTHNSDPGLNDGSCSHMMSQDHSKTIASHAQTHKAEPTSHGILLCCHGLHLLKSDWHTILIFTSLQSARRMSAALSCGLMYRQRLTPRKSRTPCRQHPHWVLVKQTRATQKPGPRQPERCQPHLATFLLQRSALHCLHNVRS